MADINKYATGIGFEDRILWDYKTNTPKETLQNTRDFGMQVHIWTFKDDVLLFNSADNLVFMNLYLENVRNCSKGTQT